MTTLRAATELVRLAQARTGKPLAIVLAGHNGSGKSSLWYGSLADRLRLPLVNADRLMLSILPEPGPGGHLTPWAATLRDTDRGWMAVAQQGVQAFVAHAMGARVPFAMETVFSHWQPRPDGTTASKVDLIRDMQRAGYFVLLIFVGLESADLSILRVQTRVARGGHGIDEPTLRRRFPRTQRAIAAAAPIADATILTDNSRGPRQAFTVCRIQLAAAPLYDIRDAGPPAAPIAAWLPLVSPAA